MSVERGEEAPPPRGDAVPAGDGDEPFVADLGDRFLHPHGAASARSRRIGRAAAAVVIAAAVASIVALLVPDDPAGATVVAEAAALHALPAEGSPPAATSATLLALDAEGIPFPRLEAASGWRATGTRDDVVRDRRAVTVFYERRGHRIGYTVLAGDPVTLPREAGRIGVEGTLVRTLAVDGRTVVAWRRRGRTCVMSGVGIHRRALARLAGWRGGGTVPF
ncbi:MAG: hypothetical protein AB1416_08695 [Actinomycetota bacterium]